MNGSTNFGSPHETTELETGIKEDEQKTPDITYTFCRHAIRSTYMDKSIEAKKKVCVFFIIFHSALCLVMMTNIQQKMFYDEL